MLHCFFYANGVGQQFQVALNLCLAALDVNFDHLIGEQLGYLLLIISG